MALQRQQPAKNSDPAAIASAIYHANWRDWKAGCEEWIDIFEDDGDKVEPSKSLLEMQADLIIEDPVVEARIVCLSGVYSLNLSALSTAAARFEQALRLVDGMTGPAAYRVRGSARWGLGYTHFRSENATGARALIQEGLEFLDRALAQEPDHPATLLDKVVALRVQGSEFMEGSKYDEARRSYAEALKVLECIQPDSPRALDQHADLLLDMAELPNEDQAEARRLAGEAVEMLTSSLRNQAGRSSSYGVMARAHTLRGWWAKRAGDFEAALGAFHSAEALHAECKRLSPGMRSASQGHVQVLTQITECLSALGRQDELVANQKIEFAEIRSFVQDLASDTQNQEKYYVLWSLAERMRLLGLDDDAVAAYRRTIQACEDMPGEGRSEPVRVARIRAGVEAARLLRKHERYQEALDLYHNVTEVWRDPELEVICAALLTEKAKCHEIIGETQQALACLRAAAEILMRRTAKTPENRHLPATVADAELMGTACEYSILCRARIRRRPAIKRGGTAHASAACSSGV